ncbi:hypothetical protein CLV84_1739 [Neolewinella xylanilytica]|uniref:Uncharacterized protein n=1 Tax=Neolewinella xylanilytica TaxID=1514080 RepID=A0A2S6IB98_9BACT|nr:hypothetical protein [Neolewinella xylanilytica]PPK88768.1 hypothetical protein CLV84_1739 [Neolewinella xylanilytica]
MITQKLVVGHMIDLVGCFTEEYFIRGLNASQIVKELGLPDRYQQLKMYVAMAIHLPSICDFELGGWAEFSTDNFFNYDKQGRGSKWDAKKFEKVYQGKRMPISINTAKQAWRDGMNHEKLVKVLFDTDHRDQDKYRAGGRASQIIVTRPIKCLIAKQLSPTERFTGVW